MIKTFVSTLLLSLCLASNLYAAQSTITEAEGYSCMGVDKSKKQTEQDALTDAKRKAVEFASTYIKSETQVKNFALEKDLLAAYANAEVKIIQELERSWYKDQAAGDCYKVKIKAEVVPDEKGMERISKGKDAADDPSAPLAVKVWTDKKEYRAGEKIKVYIKGNKPFYARVLYKDAGGELVQLLPNPYRSDNYFNGGAVYDIPAGGDRFDLEVGPPFGEENIIVYGSTAPMGDIEVQTRGGVYGVNMQMKDVDIRTRGVKITGKTAGKEAAASEFTEHILPVKTGR
jgi:hypothetical protein